MSWGTADVGRGAVTGDPSDSGKFRTPSLRDIALTAPYMHDGSRRTLLEVVSFYSDGGRPNPLLDRSVRPLALSLDEQADLVAFLEALTGQRSSRSSTRSARRSP